ncbi:MAG: hypothetical protein Q9191_004511 [Dirinaria sp. TL-2023a]
MNGSHELHEVGKDPTITGGTYAKLRGQGKNQKDSRTLARLGKNQVLKSSDKRSTWKESQCWRLTRFLGWLTSLAWIATLATGSIFVGTMIQGLIILNYPTYDSQQYHGTFLCWAVIAVAVFLNTVISGLLPAIEGLILIFHILGFFAILITLVYLAPHGTAADVFKTVLNEGNWRTQGLSYCVGFIGNVATFVGADAAVHMSEEIENAAVNVPRVIFTTMVLNGSTGFGMVIAVLFCLGDPVAVLVIYQPGETRRGANKVERRTSIPVVAIILVTVVPCLLALIYIGSSTVFEDVVSLSVSGLYGSYFVPCSLLLWRRTTGKMKDYTSDDEEGLGGNPQAISEPREDDIAQPPLMWGPWRVPGVLGTINNAFACVYILFVLFWSFWPPTTPATAENMNYSVLVTGAVISFSIVYYFVWGKTQYLGPLIDREVRGYAEYDRTTES